MDDGERAAQQYDAMAVEYSTDNDDGVYNSHYERPAMIAMAGDVAGLRVLDLGCGAGQLSFVLAERGAVVTGIDVSQRMVEIARHRLGDRARFEVGDMSARLPFEDNSFDIAVSSLAMHYVQDWVPTLTEVRRVLEPAGTLTFSAHHPTMDWKLFSPDNYFTKKQSTETWTKGGLPFEVTTWRRSLAEMTREIRAAGFVIDALEEPVPSESLATIDRTNYDYLTTHPHFLFVRISPRSS